MGTAATGSECPAMLQSLQPQLGEANNEIGESRQLIASLQPSGRDGETDSAEEESMVATETAWLLPKSRKRRNLASPGKEVLTHPMSRKHLTDTPEETTEVTETGSTTTGTTVDLTGQEVEKTVKTSVTRQKAGTEEDLKEFWKMVGGLKKTIKELKIISEANTRTKVEIKKGIKMADSQVDEITSRWEILMSKPAEFSKVKTQMVAAETAKVKLQGRQDACKKVYEPVRQRSCSTQVDPEMLEEEVRSAENDVDNRIRTQLDEKEGWAGCKDIINLSWSEKCYKNTSMSYGVKPLREIQGDVALILDPKKALEGMVIEEIKSMYPDITTLLTDELTTIEFIRKNTETIMSRGGREERTNTLYLLPLFTGVLSDTGDVETERLFGLLNTFKTEVDAQNPKVMKVIMADNVEDKHLRKCAEAVFTGSNTQITVISNKKKARETSKPTSGLTSGWPRLPETTGKVIVKLDGKNYADALKEVKQSIDIQKVGVQIKNIKKTAKGDVIFEVKGGKDKAQAFKGAIEEKMKSTQVEVKISESIVHISDIEADITEEDIVDAILRGTRGGKHEEIKVISIRPNHSGNKNAMVSLNKFTARELIKLGSIRIGWVPCRVRSRVSVIRCYRCLDFGHRAALCKGMDRSKTCLNCGQGNHMSKECKNHTFCTGCNVLGHRADQMKCPIFRKIINDKARDIADSARVTRRNRHENNPN